jgi:D-glycero-alpha-D-manno-heptose-7-phosphate kinase
VRREPLPLDAGAFEERFLLAYTHQPHRSGMNNWDVFKRFIDNDTTTRRALETIGRVAVEMRDALLQGRMDRIEILINEEWEARRHLAPAISSPEMECILQAALSSGARACKGCGAGGGGCLLIAVRPDTRNRVEDAIVKAGGSIITFHIALDGLSVEGGVGSDHR